MMTDEFKKDMSEPVSDDVIEQFKRTRPWVLTFVIIGFLSTAISLAFTITMLFTESGAADKELSIDLVVSTLYFLVLYFIYKYSSSLGTVINSKSNIDLEIALAAQARAWKYLTLVVVISIILLVVDTGLSYVISALLKA